MAWQLKCSKDHVKKETLALSRLGLVEWRNVKASFRGWCSLSCVLNAEFAGQMGDRDFFTRGNKTS